MAPAGESSAECLARAEHWAAEAARWDGDVTESRRELEELEASAAVSVLADPGSLESVTARTGALRDRVRIGEQAAVEARRLEGVARADALRAEADELQPQVDEARARLEEHNARTAELLEALREHTLQQWWPGELAVEPGEQHLFAPGSSVGPAERIGVRYRAARGDQFRGEVARLRRRQEELRARADGRSLPDPLLTQGWEGWMAFDAAMAEGARLREEAGR